MENKPKKKKSIGLYFLGMLILFIVLFILQQLGIQVLYNSFIYLKYGRDIIAQAIWAALVLILLLLFKNSYVFSQEKMGFWESFKYGWPELVLSAVFLIVSGKDLLSGTVSVPVLLNLALYCFLIGVVEEFLCRGWLFNEFLERFSDTKKGVILSVVLSSLIFGFIHFFNMAGGQGVAETIVQVLNATVGGIFLTLVYYKTKNIWTVITLHAIWDYTLMVSESQSLVDCYSTGNATSSIVIYSIIQSIVLIIAYLLIDYWLYKQTDIAEKEKPLKKLTMILLPIIGIIVYLAGLFFIESPDAEDYYICPEFSTGTFSEEFKVNQYHYSEFTLTNKEEEKDEEAEEYHFVLTSNGKTGAVELKNVITDEKISLTTGRAFDYLLIENEVNFIILIQSEDNKVLYTSIDKQEIENNKEFLEYVKSSLTEYVTPSISYIGSATKAKDDDYEYPIIETITSEHFFFDQYGQFLLVTSEEE